MIVARSARTRARRRVAGGWEDARVHRIASLLPSATEWVYALGLDADLVAVTFECDHPVQARTEKQVVVGGLDTAGLTPAEIDAAVRAKAAAGEDLYTLDAAALAALAPDVVLTQDLCRVCALPAGAVGQALATVGCPGTIVTLDPRRLDDVLDGALDVAGACGVPERGHELRAALQARLDAVARAVDGAPRPRVLVLEWSDPPFLAGHWVPDLVTAAGGEPVLAAPGDRSTTCTWDDVAAVDVDVVLVAPCGYGLSGAVTQARAISARLPTGAAVLAVDAGAVITRPGPRVVDGVEAIAAALHPGRGIVPRPDLLFELSPAGRDASSYARTP
jgi:iron complex transport system substrate-binding protein